MIKRKTVIILKLKVVFCTLRVVEYEYLLVQGHVKPSSYFL